MIQTVEKNYLEGDFENYKVTLTDNTIVWVPHQEANKDYQEILEWVAAGNTITDPGA